MPNFITEYFSTLLVGSIVLLVIILVIRKMISDKKKGKSCGCGCSDCPSGGACHSK